MIGALFVMVLLGFIYIEAYCIMRITERIKWLRGRKKKQ